MPWRYDVPLSHRQQGWIAAITFTLVGVGIWFGMPRVLSPQDASGLLPALRFLGGACILLGVLGLAGMLGDRYLQYRSPERREAWFWGVQMWLGALGALIYAVPATLVLPVMLVFYSLRPNALFPAGTSPAGNLLVGAIFSVTGAAALVGVVVLLRQGRNKR